jgi:uncharacterized protein (TIGR02246 family)
MTKLTITLSITVIVSFAVICCTQHQEISRIHLDAVEKGNARFMEGVEKKDAEMVASVYTTDALLLPPGQNSVKGRAQIREFRQAMNKSAIDKVILKTLSLETAGELLVEIGSFEAYVNDSLVNQGKTLILWKEEAGTWQIYRSCYNSSPLKVYVQNKIE